MTICSEQRSPTRAPHGGAEDRGADDAADELGHDHRNYELGQLMDTFWAVALIVFGLLAWGGQTISWFAPRTAERLSLVEREDTVEPVYWADIRGEALWDLLTLWTLVAAGVLLLLDHRWWPYFGLLGGAVYLYFAGRGILSRLEMQRRGFRIGDPGTVRLGLIMLSVWGAVGAITVIASITSLNGS